MRTARLLQLLFLCLSLSDSAFAQDYVYATGNPSFGVNVPVENGFINVTNGNLHLEFPLATHKQRGSLSLNERLVYDSRIWMIGHYSNYYWWPNNIPNTPNTQGGWRFVTGNETGNLVAVGSLPSETISDGCPVPPYYGQHTRTYTIMAWNDPSGAMHKFDATVVSDQDDCTNTYSQHVIPGYATDATGYLLDQDASGNPVVRDNTGTQVYPQVIDRFGNYWSTDSNGNLVDDLGRTPAIVTKNGNVTYYDVLAPNGPINNNGTRVRYTVTTAPIQVKTYFHQPVDNGGYIVEWPDDSGAYGTLYPVQSIQLPDGTSYTFTYDSKVLAGDTTAHYGDLKSITLPTGGVVNYRFAVFEDSYYNQNRWLSSRTLGSSVNVDPTTSFTHSVVSWCGVNGLNCKEKTIVRRPSGDETVYEQQINSGAWNTNMSAYTGSASDSSVATTSNTYSFQCSGCSSNFITKSTSVTTLSNGVSSQQQYVYDAPWTGKPTALKEWDYFSGSAPSNPTRETDYTYTGFDLYQETIKSGDDVNAQTVYEYTSSATATSGVNQHGVTNAGGPYLQKITRWLNGGTNPITNYVMDDTGMVRSVTDPRGNPTTFSYQCSNAFPYQTMNALNQTTLHGYDCNSGAVTSVRDPNDLAANRSGTTYQYEGTAGRLQSIRYPDGGQTSYAYPSATEVDISTTATPNPTITSQDFVDSFGRTHQHVADGISTETSYDSNGRVYCVTNPHLSTSLSTDGSTCITSYDGLDRPKLQSQPGGPTVSWDYSGNVVTATNETGISSQRTSDAFGNLTKVVEPGGLNTTYLYSVVGNLKCIDQWETNSPGTPCASSHARAFKYDSLSRQTAECNPEALPSNQSCDGSSIWSRVYDYDAAGNVAHKTDARGVTIGYSYDILNRLIYKSGPGISDTHVYDVEPAGSGVTTSNGIGRLVFETNNTNADGHYSYDPLGRVLHQQGCSPSNCIGTANTITASYDVAGNMTSLTYPDGRKVAQSFDAAGRVSSVNYASWNGNAKSYAYLSNPNYTPAGSLIGSTMGNGISIASGYDNRHRIGMLAYGTSAQLLWGKGYQWTPNGNLQAITDAFSGIQRQFGYDNLNRLTVAQDIVGSATGANTTPFATGTGATTGTNTSGAQSNPYWTDSDDSNVLPEVGGPGWDSSGTQVDLNAATAPDGTVTATRLIASATNSYLAGYALSPVSLSGETVTTSVWLRTVSGTLTVTLFQIDQGPNGRAYHTQSIALTPTWKQFHATGAVQNNITGLLMQIGGDGTFNTGNSILMWHPMIEDEGVAGTSVTNFLLSSQRLTGGFWSGPISALTDNTGTAPDGTNTAATITECDGCYIVNNIANPAPYSDASVTGSVWLRSPDGTTQQTLLTLVETGTSGFNNALGSQTVTVTPNWQRFQISGTTQSTLTQLQLQIGGGGTFAAGKTLSFWGAQMELASVAGPYVATGAAPVTRGTSMTNILPYSQQFNAPNWYPVNVSVAANSVAAPDGTITAARLSTAAGVYDCSLVGRPNNYALYEGTTVTASIYLKVPSGSQTISLAFRAGDANGNYQYVGPTSVTVTSTWKRFELTSVLPSVLTDIGVVIGGWGTLANGQAVDVWGAQMELSSHAGPYVPTSALPVVTGQDVVNLLHDSQQLNGPTWQVVRASINSSTTTAPDGTQTAAAIVASDDSYVINNVPNPSLYDQQTVTGSVYLRVPSGTLNTSIYLIDVGESGWSVPGQTAITLTTDWQRFSVTGTNQNGLTQLGLQIGGAGTLNSGTSLQIWGAQLVIGSAAAPYMPTPSTGGGVNLITGQPATLITNGLNQTYRYDSFGNILENGSFNDTYTSKNQMLGFVYDAAGNLLTNGFTAYTWDAEGRMATGGGASYVYDPQGNRVSVHEASVTDTVYFGGLPVARYNAGTWTDLIYGPTGLLAEVQGTENAEPIYRLTDHLGGSIGQVGNNGLLINPVEYTPFGQLMAGSTSDPFQYTAMERDQETGLDHATFRQYSSTMGRWLAPDPYLGSMDLANPQSLNRYSYVGNSPLGYTDPSGLARCGNCSGGDGNSGSTNISIPGIDWIVSQIESIFSHPQCMSCDHPRQSGHIWDEHGGFHATPYSSIASMIGDVGGWYPGGCEFGSCGGTIGDSLQQAGTIAAPLTFCQQNPALCTAALGAARVLVRGLEMGVMLSSDSVKPDASNAKCYTRYFAEQDRCTAKFGGGGRFGRNRDKGACLDRAYWRFNACVSGIPDPAPPLASIQQSANSDTELASLTEDTIIVDFGNDMGKIQ
jgi:RHS repeat-associated protein